MTKPQGVGKLDIRWAIRDFLKKLEDEVGPSAVTTTSQRAKFREEVQEFLAAGYWGTRKEILEEAADVIITVYGYTTAAGIAPESVEAEVARKMEINLTRTWSLRASGAAHHD